MTVQVLTLRVDAVTEQVVAAAHDILDEAERTRASRFVFPRDRISFILAHALLRVALSSTVTGVARRDWRFVAGAYGKPAAWIGDVPAPLTFNLSHTNGMVGLATVPRGGCALGFDLEAVDRTVALDLADRFFRPEEAAWLHSLPVADRSEGFLRLWTLKECFIKATGKGLSQDLAEFWFTLPAPRIHFTRALRERPQDWTFEQHVIDGRFVAAMGLRRPDNVPIVANWANIDPSCFLQGGGTLLSGASGS